MTKETISNEGPQCPFCGYQITADEPHYYDESGYTHEECLDCEKTFTVSVWTTTTWLCTEQENRDATS